MKKTSEEVEVVTTSDTLALRYRPKTLEEVVGHESVKPTLRGVFKSKRLPNAMLFVGGTGVGKTTLARLVTRYLNCAERNACGKCESCDEMDNDSHPDLLEVNASEAGNIETVRSLIEGAKFKPSNRVRVVFLDEIHRASHAAFQALLVPVETPSAKTLWLFATTEPAKVLKALLGRCQVFSLHPPSKGDIAGRLRDIAKAEGYKWLTKEAAVVAADYSQGSVRNAVQILERAALSIDKKTKDVAKLMEKISAEVTGDDLEELAGELLEAIYSGNEKAIVNACLQSPDMVVLLGRAVFVNSNSLSVNMVGAKEGVWRSKAVVSLDKSFGKKRPNAKRMSQVTVALLEIRSQLMGLAQQHPQQYAMARLMLLGGK